MPDTPIRARSSKVSNLLYVLSEEATIRGSRRRSGQTAPRLAALREYRHRKNERSLNIAGFFIRRAATTAAWRTAPNTPTCRLPPVEDGCFGLVTAPLIKTEQCLLLLHSEGTMSIVMIET